MCTSFLSVTQTRTRTSSSRIGNSRRAHPSLLSAATRWWRPRGSGSGGDCTPGGIVEVENQAHCDFVKLRNMLIRTHMHDLKDVTCDVHYENYRAHCIQQMTSKLTQDSRMESPIPILPLPTPDAETEKLIRMKDEELRRMQEMLQKMKQQMQDQ